MDKNEYPETEPGASAYYAAMAIEHSVRAIRKAQGKKNPEDCVIRSPEWAAVEQDFLNDLARALDSRPDRGIV
ncbi:MAG TPA: hypothetical protein VNE00_18285 [Paraburkholderia sp.]|jgi:hypothetical protein|nr:hypothetical protein [Paraburkholderia sp.]